MLTPALTIVGGRVLITVGAAIASQMYSQGIGFLNNGRLPIDSAAPAGNIWNAGMRLNSSGCPYGTTAVNATDVYLGGLRFTTQGQLVYADAASTGFSNGTPITATGAMAGNTA